MNKVVLLIWFDIMAISLDDIRLTGILIPGSCTKGHTRLRNKSAFWMIASTFEKQNKTWASQYIVRCRTSESLTDVGHTSVDVTFLLLALILRRTGLDQATAFYLSSAIALNMTCTISVLCYSLVLKIYITFVTMIIRSIFVIMYKGLNGFSI